MQQKWDRKKYTLKKKKWKRKICKQRKSWTEREEIIIFQKKTVLWDVAPCSSTEIDGHFRSAWSLCHQDDDSHPHIHRRDNVKFYQPYYFTFPLLYSSADNGRRPNVVIAQAVKLLPDQAVKLHGSVQSTCDYDTDRCFSFKVSWRILSPPPTTSTWMLSASGENVNHYADEFSSTQ